MQTYYSSREPLPWGLQTWLNFLRWRRIISKITNSSTLGIKNTSWILRLTFNAVCGKIAITPYKVALAVNKTNGMHYVTERGNDQVERFHWDPGVVGPFPDEFQEKLEHLSIEEKQLREKLLF